MKKFSEFRQELDETKTIYPKGYTSAQKKKYDDTFDRYKHPYSIKNIMHKIKRYKDEIGDMIRNPNNNKYESPVSKKIRKQSTDAFDKKLKQKD